MDVVAGLDAHKRPSTHIGPAPLGGWYYDAPMKCGVGTVYACVCTADMYLSWSRLRVPEPMYTRRAYRARGNCAEPGVNNYYPKGVWIFRKRPRLLDQVARARARGKRDAGKKKAHVYLLYTQFLLLLLFSLFFSVYQIFIRHYRFSLAHVCFYAYYIYDKRIHTHTNAFYYYTHSLIYRTYTTTYGFFFFYYCFCFCFV